MVQRILINLLWASAPLHSSKWHQLTSLVPNGYSVQPSFYTIFRSTLANQIKLFYSGNSFSKTLAFPPKSLKCNEKGDYWQSAIVHFILVHKEINTFHLSTPVLIESHCCFIDFWKILTMTENNKLVIKLS